MSRRLPPLNALRAFEAAARHLSFTHAAAELNVTPAAVGHQVKALEDFLGLRLFRRLNRALLLTDAGQASLGELRDGFDTLGRAVERMRAGDARGMLTVTIAPSLAAKWLIPRLDRFRAAHPEITVRIDTAMPIIDLEREGVDVGIRFCAGDEPGLRSDRLFFEELFPVCSPKLLEGRRPVRTPADLRRHTLLHLDGETRDETWPDWRMWLAAAGCTEIDATPGPRFTQSIMLVQAAIAGHGVALGPRAIVADDLAAGRLVRPFGDAYGTRTAFAYYVVCPEASAVRAKVVAFREWVLAEARAAPAPHAAALRS